MYPINKVQIPKYSSFDAEIAMELANLITVAYDEYEVWDGQGKRSDKLPLHPIKSSKNFVSLPVDQLEGIKVDGLYGRLDQFWHQTDQTTTYERLNNFWFPQWWWGEVLNPQNVWQLLQSNVQDIFKNLKELVSEDQIFGFIARSASESNKFVVVFRGTREAAEWFNNFRPIPKPFLSKDRFGNLGEVRNGFNLIYSSKEGRKSEHLSIQKTIENFFDEQDIKNDSQIFVTGHSLGAGLATLAALHLQKLAEKKGIQPFIQLYSFASPRVGDKTFAEHFDGIKSFRIINSEDLIQSVPLPTTKIVDQKTFSSMSPAKKARFISFRQFLKGITGGQSEKCYQHVGLPITFTQQTGTIAGNHNLTKTYREAIDIKGSEINENVLPHSSINLKLE